MVKSEVATEVVLLQGILDDNHRLTAEKKHLRERITHLSEELGKQEAENISLKIRLRTIIEVYGIQGLDQVPITNSMFGFEDGGING